MIAEIIRAVAEFLGLGGQVVTGIMLMMVLLYWRRIADYGDRAVGWASTAVILIAALGALSILDIVDLNLDQLFQIISIIWDWGGTIASSL